MRAAPLLLLLLAPLAWSASVRDFGAKGDGVVKDTRAIQSAIDSAAKQGGGTVTFPAGRYLSGTIHLLSNVTLHLDNGAVLLASPDETDFDPYEKLPFESVSDKETTYFHYALIAAENVHDIAIEGRGTVDGNRTKRGGPKTIAIKLAERVSIRGITVRNSPNYSISLWGADYVDIDGVTILNSYADGIDPDSCRYVRISNSYIDAHDDAICPKASPSMGMDRRRPVEHLTVTNCVLRTDASHFKFGTESSGDFRHVAVTNCTMSPRASGGRPRNAIALESVDGAHIDGVVISNIEISGVTTPIFLRLGNRGRGLDPRVPGTLENVSIQNVVARDCTMASSVTGLPGHPVRGVRLDNLRLGMKGGEPAERTLDVPEAETAYPEGHMFGTLPGFAFYARHVQDLSLSNLHARWDTTDARPALVFEDVKDLLLDGFRADTLNPAGSAVWLHNVFGAFLRGSRTTGSRHFLQISGPASAEIAVTGNDFTRTPEPLKILDAPPKAARLSGNVEK
jgi:polygalacturonase